MKKNVIAFGLALTMALTMTACTSIGTPVDITPEPEREVPEAGQVASGEITGDHFSISLFCGSMAENTPAGGATAVMADYINAYSDGTIEATAFYDTALGDATSMVQGLQQGTIDIGIAGTSYFSNLVPEIDVFQLPFLFDNLDQARAATAGPAAEKIHSMFEENGIIGLSFWENGFRELTNNVRPISEPDDMVGIKMRTLSSDVQIATWEAMGALTTSIDASELYTALQQNTVNAQDNPLHEIVSRKFYEVQPYVTLTDAVYTPLYMGMSKMTWDRMSDSQRALIKEAADVARTAQLELVDEAQASALQTLIDNGCEIIDNPDKEAFREKATPSWALFTDVYGTELVDMIQEQIANMDTEDTQDTQDAQDTQSAADTAA